MALEMTRTALALEDSPALRRREQRLKAASAGARRGSASIEAATGARQLPAAAGVDHGDERVLAGRLRRAAAVGGQLAVEGGDEFLNLGLHLGPFFRAC